MANFMNFHLVESDFESVFICSIYGHLQYHFRMEEVNDGCIFVATIKFWEKACDVISGRSQAFIWDPICPNPRDIQGGVVEQPHFAVCILPLLYILPPFGNDTANGCKVSKLKSTKYLSLLNENSGNVSSKSILGICDMTLISSHKFQI